MKRFVRWIIFFLPIGALVAEDWCHDLMRDLQTLRYWQCRLNTPFPTTYNFYSQGGYFMMPSARMGESGEMGVGFSSVPPYYNYNIRTQLLPNLEITASYRVFRGVDDPMLSEHGFGDFADKGANVKLALWRPEDSGYKIPGIAIGWDDFLGTKSFESQYIVATQVLKSCNLEVSLGWGRERIRGFFGGALWMPFFDCGNPYFSELAVSAEYDAINYDEDPHPESRDQKWPVNFGLKWRLFDYMDLSAAWVRGDKVALGASLWYNFGETRGFLPKVDDKLPYTAPANMEPLGCWRPDDILSEELYSALCVQGFRLLDLYLYYNSCGEKVLHVMFKNEKYWEACVVRNRITHVLTYLLPLDIDKVIAVQYSQGFPIQEYHFWGDYLRDFQAHHMSEYELALVSPMEEVTCVDSDCPKQLFYQGLKKYEAFLLPRVQTYFGSSKGKFKYAAGLTLDVDGFASKWEIYWRARLGYLLFSSLGSTGDVDMLNPSQLINVHTDVINYDKQRGLRIDELYLQKNWTIGCGWYAKLAAGYFDQMYAGASGEVLWYPIASPLAIGVRGAVLKRRTLQGLGFTDNIRKLDGFTPTYVYFLGTQYFVDVYYDWRACSMTFHATAGKFLANDWGSRFELSRYFPSGLRVYFWYTLTNGDDVINGHTYYDKGVGFSMPLDIFFTSSSTSRFGYGISAWLRDVGYQAPTGPGLYNMIYYERQ